MNQSFNLSKVEATPQLFLAMMNSTGFLESIAKVAIGYFGHKLFAAK